VPNGVVDEVRDDSAQRIGITTYGCGGVAGDRDLPVLRGDGRRQLVDVDRRNTALDGPLIEAGQQEQVVDQA
jgi:hypothetical protein